MSSDECMAEFSASETHVIVCLRTGCWGSLPFLPLEDTFKAPAAAASDGEPGQRGDD